VRSHIRVLVLTLATVLSARAWDYEGHRFINQTAITLLPTNFPAWVREPSAQERIAFLAGELDRWRNTPHYTLRHANNPDHYLDLEDLVPLELIVTNLPIFRYEFVAHLTRVRLAHPERFPAIAATNDLDRTRTLPGFLPWTIAEQFARLKSAFSSLAAYEKLGNPDEITNARASVIDYLGILGHAVGDATQPLHTTRHYNGWVGENPKGYATTRSFHGWIDGGYLRRVGIPRDAIQKLTRPARALRGVPTTPSDDPIFREACVFIGAQFERMEPLYQLDKAGGLSGKPPKGLEGQAYLGEQLSRAANFLADLWLTAFEQAPPDTFLLGQLAQRGDPPPAKAP